MAENKYAKGYEDTNGEVIYYEDEKARQDIATLNDNKANRMDCDIATNGTLDSVPFGCGMITIANTDLRPNKDTSVYTYVCSGNASYKQIIICRTSTAETWIASKDNGASWTSWQGIMSKSELPNIYMLRNGFPNGVSMKTVDSGFYHITSSNKPLEGIPSGFNEYGKLIVMQAHLYSNTDTNDYYCMYEYVDINGKVAVYDGVGNAWKEIAFKSDLGVTTYTINAGVSKDINLERGGYIITTYASLASALSMWSCVGSGVESARNIVVRLAGRTDTSVNITALTSSFGVKVANSTTTTIDVVIRKVS